MPSLIVTPQGEMPLVVRPSYEEFIRSRPTAVVGEIEMRLFGEGDDAGRIALADDRSVARIAARLGGGANPPVPAQPAAGSRCAAQGTGANGLTRQETPEILGQLRARGVPPAGLLLQGLQADGPEVPVHVRVHRARVKLKKMMNAGEI